MGQERYRQIKKKVLILKNRKPFSAETACSMAERNQLDWITSCLKVSGSPISGEGVKKIADGELLVDVSLNNHQLIHRYLSVMRHMQSMLEMGTNLTEKGLLQIYEILFDPRAEAEQRGVDFSYYRTGNSFLEAWKYETPHWEMIRERMGAVFRWLGIEEGRVNPDLNPMLRAVKLHNIIIGLYPFGEHSPSMARAAMLYELMAAGLPPIRIPMSEQEYNCAIVLYLKKEDHSPLYDAVEEGMFHQLDMMVQLTAIR